jgi:hypothetical protein
LSALTADCPFGKLTFVNLVIAHRRHKGNFFSPGMKESPPTAAPGNPGNDMSSTHRHDEKRSFVDARFDPLINSDLDPMGSPGR